MVEAHKIGRRVLTSEFVQAIRKPLEAGGKPCAANIYITACHSGHNRVRSQLLDMHSQYGAGACFLLSGKKSAWNISTDAAIEECAISLCPQNATETVLLPHTTSWRRWCATGRIA
jgi:hypothetical protein